MASYSATGPLPNFALNNRVDNPSLKNTKEGASATVVGRELHEDTVRGEKLNLKEPDDVANHLVLEHFHQIVLLSYFRIPKVVKRGTNILICAFVFPNASQFFFLARLTETVDVPLVCFLTAIDTNVCLVYRK